MTEKWKINMAILTTEEKKVVGEFYVRQMNTSGHKESTTYQRLIDGRDQGFDWLKSYNQSGQYILDTTRDLDASFSGDNSNSIFMILKVSHLHKGLR